MVHKKSEYMGRERVDSPFIKTYLEQKLSRNLRDATLDEQRMGIDFVDIDDGTTFESKLREVSERKYLDKDILIETISNDVIMSHGWIEYIKSDYLVYLFKPINDLKGHILFFPKLKKWWDENKDKEDWVTKKVPNVGYFTINRVIPLNFLPKTIFFYSDVFSGNELLSKEKRLSDFMS